MTQLTPDQLLQQRLLYLQEWTTGVLPMDKNAAELLKHAVVYGSGALQASYILNGGALAALPALLTSLTTAGADRVALAAIPFVVGIAATAGSSLASYLNFGWNAQVSIHDRQNKAAELNQIFNGTQNAPPDPKNREKLHAKVQRSLVVGVVLGVIGLVAFVVGCLIFISLAASFSSPTGDSHPPQKPVATISPKPLK